MTIDSNTPAGWINIENCPACGDSKCTHHGTLTSKLYHFGKAVFPLPASGISIAECNTCRLYYKTVLPTPAFLAEAFENQAGEVWDDDYNFISEKNQIENILKNDHFDLLDVGPSNGALLNAFRNTSGRRSGLDIVQHPGLEKHLQGEFIHCLIDDERLNWGQQPYDVITAFDVLEHFYNPATAFRNLHALLNKDGIVMIETGDISSYWPSKHGANRWWYTNLLEHHIFWQPESIVFHAHKHGFKVLSVAAVRHKSWQSKSILEKLNKTILFDLWRISPTLYRKINDSRGKPTENVIPWSPLTIDHMSIIMKKT